MAQLTHKGLILKQARESKGIPLQTVHEVTKIPLDALKAIEEGYKIRTLSDFYYSHILKSRMFKHLFVYLLYGKERTVEGRVADYVMSFGLIVEHLTNIAEVLPHVLEVLSHVIGEQVAILVIRAGNVVQRFPQLAWNICIGRRFPIRQSACCDTPGPSHRLPIKLTGIAPIREIFQPVHIRPQLADVGNAVRIGGDVIKMSCLSFKYRDGVLASPVMMRGLVAGLSAAPARTKANSS